MSLWVIIPVKPLRRSKSRLANVLSEDERTQLNFNMLDNTLKILKGNSAINEILVISRDPKALTLARFYGAKTIQEDGEPGLNLALKRAVVIAKAYSAQTIWILPADLPLLTGQEVQYIIDKITPGPMMIISPDRRMDGTNLLLCSPVDLIDFSYGPGSFERHMRQAQSKHAEINVMQMSSVGLDIDLPEDLEIFQKMQLLQSASNRDLELSRGDKNV